MDKSKLDHCRTSAPADLVTVQVDTALRSASATQRPWHGRCDVTDRMPRLLTRTSEIVAGWARAYRHWFPAAVLAISSVLWISTVLLVWLLTTVVVGLPDDEALRSVGTMSQATTIFDRHNKAAFTIFKEHRIEVPLSRISPHLIRAVIAVEDQRFMAHAGIDPVRVAGAAWTNLRDGWGTQGGSTITQQLARQSLLTREKTLRRKLKEVIVAARLEQAFSKHEILELYLNKVYFGDGLYGVEAASLGYFGKHAAELDVAEAALLAGLIKRPSAYAPTVSMQRAQARRKSALEAMRGQGVIDAATFESAVSQAVRLNDVLRGREMSGQYFKEAVRQELVAQFGWERVYEGGLQVFTTLDPEMQQAAEAEVVRAVEEIERRQPRRGEEPLQAALVAVDPGTGEIRAMVGGRSFEQSHFNRAVQARRQAGSAFKTFVYAAALERGYTPASLITPMQEPIVTFEGAWVPDDHTDGGLMTMRSALRLSSNRAAVGMLQTVGIPAALSAAERFGIESVPGVWSLALGSGEVTLLSMTAAYAAFANGGMRPEPILIRRVETTDGEVLFNAALRAHRAVSEATAYLITSMLSDVVNAGTGSMARRAGFTHPAAGKTGTTNEYRDAWFVGYTPNLATGVWVGYDRPRTILARGYAATLAVPLWGRFMAAATRNEKPRPFERPRTVVPATICRISGKLATGDCRAAESVDTLGDPVIESLAITEYFTRGTEPVDYCTWHRPVAAIAASTSPAPAAAHGDDEGPPLLLPIATTGTMAPAAAAPAVATPTSAASVATLPATPQASQPPAQPRRPGFWGRLFRRGATAPGAR